MAIFDSLRQQSNVVHAELEKDLGGSVADVYAEISGARVAIEVQRSNLSVVDVVLRTRNYHACGVAVVWISLRPVAPPAAPDEGPARYSPSAWEKWCHAAYYGRVYRWVEGQTLQPVHFGTFMLYAESTDWGGGYWYPSKRWKKPSPGVPVRLSEDFRAVARSAWRGGAVDVPECTLYVDTQARWWR